MQEERRKYVRFDSDTKINFQVQGEGRERAPLGKISAIAKNLSIEGICFMSEKELQSGTILNLEIQLPSQSKPLHLQGQVRWSAPLKQEGRQIFQIGVKLFTIEKSDENRFVGYVCDKMTQRLSQYLHL